MEIKQSQQILFLMLFLLGLSGCPEIGYLVSPVESAADQGILRFSNPVDDFIKGAITVGVGLGYQAASVPAGETGEIAFTKSEQILNGIIGKHYAPRVYLLLSADKRIVYISANLSANFKDANQGAVAQIIADFKKGLTEKFSGFGPQL